MKTNSFYENVMNLLNTLIRVLSLGMLTVQTLFGQSTSQPNTALPPFDSHSLSDPSRQVIINSVRLSDEQVRSLEQQYRIPIQDGAYWYDQICGAWGLQGGPQAGVIQAGLNLGGPLRPDASNGNTGVFVNGRQLHQVDVLRLQQLGPVYAGRYWVDAYGNFGLEGGPMLGNLMALMQPAGSYGSNTVNSRFGTLNTDGNGNYFYQGNGIGGSDDNFYSNW